jgi:hypothetical protein
MLQRIADEWIPDPNAEKGQHDPGLGPVVPSKDEDDGQNKQDGSPKPTIGQDIEELVQPEVVEATVDPAQNR